MKRIITLTTNILIATTMLVGCGLNESKDSGNSEGKESTPTKSVETYLKIFKMEM